TCVLVRGPEGVCTSACTVTVLPWWAKLNLTHDSASPGCGTTVKPSVHGGGWPMIPGLVTDTPAGTGGARLNWTGIPLATTAPPASVTSALITALSVPSPLLLACCTNNASSMCPAAGVGVAVMVGVWVFVGVRVGVKVSVGVKVGVGVMVGVNVGVAVRRSGRMMTCVLVRGPEG